MNFTPPAVKAAYALKLMSLYNVCLLFFIGSRGKVITHVVNFGVY